MIDKNSIRKSYEYFYRLHYQDNNKYTFHYTDREEKHCESFLKEVQKHFSLNELGDNFLFRYCHFQYKYWNQINLTSVKKIKFHFYFGSKSYKTYLNRNQDYDFTLDSSNEVNVQRFTQYIHKGQKHEKIESYRNPNRLINLNRDSGLATCLSLTTLYDHKDMSCVMCKYKKTCKELLKTNFKRIYKERGYDRDSSTNG